MGTLELKFLFPKRVGWELGHMGVESARAKPGDPSESRPPYPGKERSPPGPHAPLSLPGQLAASAR